MAYEDNVFLNVPFDRRYLKLFRSLIFAVHDCGFVARCAAEIEDSGQARVEKIFSIIEDSQYGIHDVSRAGIDRKTGVARFNMPLELGFFLGAKRFGGTVQARKRCLVLDREKYRYRMFCSDISGQDIRAHQDDPKIAIRAVRDWLSGYRKETIIPGGSEIFKRYEAFRHQLPEQSRALKLSHRELTFGDYTYLVVGWLQENLSH